MNLSPLKRPISYKPTIVMDGASAASASSVTLSILTAAAIMLVLGSKALLSWANDLPIGRVSDFLLYLAQTWQDWMASAHLTAFSDTAFNILRQFQALTW